MSSAGSKTLRRGLQLFATLRMAGEAGLHVADLAAASGIARPSTYRLLAVLAEAGFVERAAEDPVFRICPVDQPPSGDARQRLIERMRPKMRRISDATGDSAFLVVRDGDDALCAHREIGDFPVQVLSVPIGHRQPLGVGAAGLAYLAALPPAEASAVIERSADSLQAYGRMTTAAMRRLVESARTRGWAVVGNAAVQGVLGVGVALLDGRGRPRLAISVSSLIDRMPPARQRAIAALIRGEMKGSGRGPAGGSGSGTQSGTGTARRGIARRGTAEGSAMPPASAAILRHII